MNSSFALADPATVDAVRSLAGNAATVAHKFGGSSLADSEGFRRVADNLLAREDGIQIVVASATQGTTDTLLKLSDDAVRRVPGWPAQLHALRDRHLQLANELLASSGSATQDWLQQQFAELETLLQALSVLGSPSQAAQEKIQGLGEVWSSRILADFFRSRGEACDWLDAREILHVAPGELGVAALSSR